MSTPTPPQGPLTDGELDAVYTHLCQTMTGIGESRSSLFLARFALLAMVEIGHAGTVHRLIDAAAADLDALQE